MKDKAASRVTMLGETPIVWQHHSEWIVEAQQERSRETMRKILDAAISLFVERGYAATTVAQIADKAGVASGSIYRRFPDKDAIMNTITESYYATRIGEFEALKDVRLARMERPEEVLAFYHKMVFSAYRRDRGIVRVIERKALEDPDTQRRLHESVSHVAHGVAEHLARVTPTLVLEEAYERVVRWHLLMRSMIVGVVLPGTWQEKDQAIEDEAFEKGIYRLMQAWFAPDVVPFPDS